MILLVLVVALLLLAGIWSFFRAQPKTGREAALKRYNKAVVLVALALACMVALLPYLTGQSMDCAWWPVLATLGSLFLVSILLIAGTLIRFIFFSQAASLDEDKPVIVKPHHNNDDQGQYTDIAMTSLYSASASIVNSERQTVWQRYSAILIANSVMAGFVGSQARKDETLLVVGGSILGMILCWLWWLLTIDGWRFWELYCRVAQRFNWPDIGNCGNTINEMFDEIDNFPYGDRIRKAALGVILVFICAYFLLIAWAITPPVAATISRLCA